MQFLATIIPAIVLVYIFYRSEIHWRGIKRDYYLPYYIIVSTLILFSFSTSEIIHCEGEIINDAFL